jgi:hypothetical protein
MKAKSINPWRLRLRNKNKKVPLSHSVHQSVR